MNYVRPVDFDNAPGGLPGGYKGQYLFHGESCRVLTTKVPPGAAGPPNHIHPTSDQVYFVQEGETTIKLGSEVKKVGPNSLIYIPSGVPHHNWNESGTTELHLEVIGPPPPPNAPSVELTDSDDAMELPYYVREVDESKFSDDVFAIDWLHHHNVGDAKHFGLYVGVVPAGAAGPPLHFHAFDQFYFVLEGTLSVQIALTRYDVGPNNLVVLPAGVPHRQWNDGPGVERHVTILAPLPPKKTSPDVHWDVPVLLEESDEVIA